MLFLLDSCLRRNDKKEQKSNCDKVSEHENDREEIKMLNKADIEKVLDETVRLKLAADGGGVEVVDIKDDNTVIVKLTGACGCCPFSLMTLKSAVERSLKNAFPELKEVVSE